MEGDTEEKILADWNTPDEPRQFNTFIDLHKFLKKSAQSHGVPNKANRGGPAFDMSFHRYHSKRHEMESWGKETTRSSSTKILEFRRRIKDFHKQKELDSKNQSDNLRISK